MSLAITAKQRWCAWDAKKCRLLVALMSQEYFKPQYQVAIIVAANRNSKTLPLCCWGGNQGGLVAKKELSKLGTPKCLEMRSIALNHACRQFPGAMTLRCFAFQPTNEQVAQENKDKDKKANLMMFPPTDEGINSWLVETHKACLSIPNAHPLLLCTDAMHMEVGGRGWWGRGGGGGDREEDPTTTLSTGASNALVNLR